MLWGRTRRSTCGTHVVKPQHSRVSSSQEMLGRQAAGGKLLRWGATALKPPQPHAAPARPSQHLHNSPPPEVEESVIVVPGLGHQIVVLQRGWQGGRLEVQRTARPSPGMQAWPALAA